MNRFFSSLQKPKEKETTEKEKDPITASQQMAKDADVALSVTVKEFWEFSDYLQPNYHYGRPLVSRATFKKLSPNMQKWHEWYFLACQYNITHITARVPAEVFNTTTDFELPVPIEEFHIIFNLKMMDVTMMTVWCL